MLYVVSKMNERKGIQFYAKYIQQTNLDLQKGNCYTIRVAGMTVRTRNKNGQPITLQYQSIEDFLHHWILGCEEDFMSSLNE